MVNLGHSFPTNHGIGELLVRNERIIGVLALGPAEGDYSMDMQPYPCTCQRSNSTG